MVDKEQTLSIIAQNTLIAVLLIMVLVLLYMHQKRKRTPLALWKKSLDLDQHLLIFHDLYERINGFYISKQARTQCDAIEYVYGEIEFIPFIALLSLAPLDEHTVFYDLGSGTGKAVLACAMVYPVTKSVGVEVLPELHQAACQQKIELAQIEGYQEKAQNIEFLLGDFFDLALDDATLLFINATTLIGTVWTHLCQRLDLLPRLQCIITTSKPLVSSNFYVFKTTQVQMSWGIVSAYVHLRQSNNT